MAKPLILEEIEKIKILRASGATPHNIAQQLRRSQHTIQKALNCEDVAVEIQEIKKELSDFFEDLAYRMISSITDQDIKGINAYQRTLSAGIATDKMRLLRGESTENLNSLSLMCNVNDESFKEYIRKIRGVKP